MKEDKFDIFPYILIFTVVFVVFMAVYTALYCNCDIDKVPTPYRIK